MKTLKRIIITLLIGSVFAVLIAWGKDAFLQTSPEKLYHILSDSFLVPGVVIAGIGLLILASNEGTFDIITYGINSFLDIFRSNPNKKYESFYDYRSKREEYKMGFGFLLISGIILIAVSFVMYLLYQKNI